MSSFASFIALLVIFACIFDTMAIPTADKMTAKETVVDLQQQPVEIEDFIEVPANQDVAPTGATGTDMDMDMDDSASSESSEEMTMDMDEDGAQGGTAATILNGNAGIPNPNVEAELVDNDADAVSGNQLPIKGSRLPSNQGVSMAKSSSVSSAGIAIAVMAMVGLVVGSAIFVIKKYRHNLPMFVQV